MWMQINGEGTLQKEAIALLRQTREGRWSGHGTGENDRRRSAGRVVAKRAKDGFLQCSQ